MPYADPEKRREYLRAYRTKNHERIRARDRAAEQKFRDENRELVRERQRKYRAARKEHYQEYNARWHREQRANNTAYAERRRAAELVKAYGITRAQYEEMATRQGHKCAACGRSAADEKHGILCVDHCHKTGKVRGLLCSKCNLIIGQADDDVTLIRRWADYLAKA